MDGIKNAFARAKQEKRAALVAYFTAGYPTVEETVDVLMGLENGGAGMLSTPPFATIQIGRGTNIFR